MLGNRPLGRAVFAVSIVLSVDIVSAQEPDLGRTLSDGSYKVEAQASRLHYAKIAFVKHGAMATGYAEVWGPVYCFQGTLTGNVIQVDNSRARKEDEVGDREPRPYRLLPVADHEQSFMQTFSIIGTAVPVARGITGVESRDIDLGPKPLPKHEEAWLASCVAYFRESPEPPCDDPELIGTDLNDGSDPKYVSDPTTICVVTDQPQKIGDVVVPGGSCTVANVFEVMATTPNTIAPTDNDKQEAKHCGVLTLQSVLSPNLVRIAIDQERHEIANYTLPGHVFSPGRVLRRIVEVDGRVQVETTGTGTLPLHLKLINIFVGWIKWPDVDEELRRAFAKSWSSRTAEGFKRSELHDGTYQAGELSVYGATLIFRKRGDSVVGTYGKSTGIHCYQGTITPTEIHVGTNVVRRNEDYATKVVTFLPISESGRDKFLPLRFYPDSIEPFPNPRALLGTTPDILARDTKWLNECSRHFGLPEKEPPPCGDSDLQDALLSCETRSQYFRNDVACRWTPSNGCTAANVFAVMLKTPNAIATVGTTGAEAQDCGVLSVRVPGGGEARVRTEFDTKHNIIKMYTLPGHPFHPSTIFRYVVNVSGRVDVNTGACGSDSVLAKVFADTAAAYVWEGPNKALKAALSGSPTPKKPSSATKKTGSATKKKP